MQKGREGQRPPSPTLWVYMADNMGLPPPVCSPSAYTVLACRVI